ncbi:hypothetical protein [Methanobrevibacter filiformis]|uniref:Uncharacterized protein n=1 Tax=Methanobrevibacter filiformis TaxID=55758 RepID=A0A166BL91_9EURY|nr:hypothetical protein [Methanobrevibacter filiformis]KZX13514.1 hypothetical protein MBFIL_10360 [Methanobrevibacter filiformis]
MITITKKEEIIFNKIKELNSQFPKGIEENIIKENLDIYEHELTNTLKELSTKEMIHYKDKKVKLIGFDKEITAVNSKKEVKKAELDEKERKSIEVIEKLINNDNIVSKHILEGSLLYGDLKLTNFRMYHILLSLENKNIIEKIKATHGDYYKLLI